MTKQLFLAIDKTEDRGQKTCKSATGKAVGGIPGGEE
jgi:hypothetical protein